MSTGYEVLILGGPESTLPRAAIALSGGTNGEIFFWDGSTPQDSNGQMNLPISMFDSVLDWLSNEQNPQLNFDSALRISYLLSSGDVAGQGEVVRPPLAARLARFKNAKTLRQTSKKSRTKKAA